MYPSPLMVIEYTKIGWDRLSKISQKSQPVSGGGGSWGGAGAGDDDLLKIFHI